MLCLLTETYLKCSVYNVSCSLIFSTEEFRMFISQVSKAFAQAFVASGALSGLAFTAKTGRVFEANLSPKTVRMPTPNSTSTKPSNVDWYKEETVVAVPHLCNDRIVRVKLNRIIGPDVARVVGGSITTALHNHPGVATSYIVSGWYDAREITLDAHGTVVSDHIVRRKAGETYQMGMNLYHQILEVAPEGAFSVWEMAALSDGSEEEWGYFDQKTGMKFPAPKDPEFLKRLNAIN